MSHFLIIKTLMLYLSLQLFTHLLHLYRACSINNLLILIESVLMLGSDGLFCLRRYLSSSNMSSSLEKLKRIFGIHPAASPRSRGISYCCFRRVLVRTFVSPLCALWGFGKLQSNSSRLFLKLYRI